MADLLFYVEPFYEGGYDRIHADAAALVAAARRHGITIVGEFFWRYGRTHNFRGEVAMAGTQVQWAAIGREVGRQYGDYDIDPWEPDVWTGESPFEPRHRRRR